MTSPPAKAPGCDQSRSFLPETRQAAWSTGRAGWQSLVTDILWNYHRYLEETRA